MEAKPKPVEEPMTRAEIESRIDAIKESRSAIFGGLRVRYAYLSQRGYYPEDVNKPNQDAYSIAHNFCNEPTDAFFGIYDGHGRDGDKCSGFARENLPPLVAKHIKRAKSQQAKTRPNGVPPNMPVELSKEIIQTSSNKAHLDCNMAMHTEKSFDDSLSGTTSISVYLHGRRNRITICNVGDSRAVLGQKRRESGTPSNGGTSSIRALPLSRDQTPYRKDERARVRACGARILSLDQIEGLEPIPEDDDDDDLELGEELDEGGDPPRVWSPHGDYPGTAFTRSLGDAIAEELGVDGKPEMVTRELTKDDQIIVLASDGVFEFLTNQSVIDICAKFVDPLEACRAVVAESYELWLQYELRTDDITIICIFIDNVDDRNKHADYISLSQKEFPGANSVISEEEEESFIAGDDTIDDMVSTEGLKPVRTSLSKEKSKQLEKMKTKMATDREMSGMENFDIAKLFTAKTSDEKSRIAEAIRASVMFQNITDAQREMIYGVMEPIKVKKGTWIIRQGTVGDRFYIVDTGRFEVRIVPEGEEDKNKSGGNVVHVYEGSRERHAHPSFGELALMYSAPRAASIIAQTDGHLWALHRYAFKQVLAQKSERKELINNLRRIDFFRTLDYDEIERIAAEMAETTYRRGETIVEEGEAGELFYVVGQGGHCEYIHGVKQGLTEELRAGDYFGEEVLAGEDTYMSTVVALANTSCWKLNKRTLRSIFGGD
eukprot:CAMPEP_0118704850 /NCGR_PEP_ID=MMETSP0800-20121206/19501_1 /TAXON_ID=210618 ORGANISM="Striatella unipunctata, Strain CCMP2910" /NCGR_SAMPLE_ID=MMETSP0800 /ASSEMBLY_ACC=CAM_ASM_000638 /LENGTH=717 /DNA_ID=CAMNT_0006606859 /DNA_START=123 /DNA_END=2276 /DNA_ORIENTATION=+